MLIGNGEIVFFDRYFNTFGAGGEVDYNIFQLWSSFFLFCTFFGSDLFSCFLYRAFKGKTVCVQFIFGQLAENRIPTCELHILQLKLLAIISVSYFRNGKLAVIKLNNVTY